MSTGNGPVENKRVTPRAAIPLEVDVEVAGETRKVLLISKDIGAGGMFLRTVDPAPLWNKVKLIIKLPDGELFEVTGEVVRRIGVEQARQKRHPPGMAVAFDEVSRAKRKKLIALVLDLVSRRPVKEERAKQAAERVQQAERAKKSELARQAERALKAREADEADDHFASKTDALLGQLDELLDTVDEDSVEEKAAADDSMDVDIQIEVPEVDIELDLDVEAPSPADETAREDPNARLSAFLDEYRRSLKGDTHYDILGVDPKANAQQIEAAYRRLLDELKPPGPPDSLPDELVRDLSSVLGQVRNAFAILAKPDRKRAYDFLIDNSDEKL